MEICETSSCEFRIRVEETAVGAHQSARSRGQAHRGTFPRLFRCVTHTTLLPPQPPPKPRGEFERTCLSPLESGAEPAAGVLPGDELNSSAVNLLKAAIDLLPPGFFPRPRRLCDRGSQSKNRPARHEPRAEALARPLTPLRHPLPRLNSTS